MYIDARRDGDTLVLDLVGDWRALQLDRIDAALAGLDFAGARRLLIGTRALTSIDLSGAWRLRELVEQAGAAGVEVAFSDGRPELLRLVDETLSREEPGGADEVRRESAGMQPVEILGRRVVRHVREGVAGLVYLGRLTVTALRAAIRPARLRPISIARHVYDTGITAIPIVALIAFLISVIVAYMGAQQLRAFGAEIFVVDLVTIGVLRELGVLLTAIIVAGRSGSAFAAEIGSMRLNEEVDALEATGVDPYEVLVLPRVLGLVIALPLLTVIADGVGLAGGGLLCSFLLDMPIEQYLGRVNDAISPTTFWVGIIKAPVFAVLIAVAGTFRGLQVRGSSRELGRLTTVAVVQAIFLVILADALFAVLFMELDI